VRVLPRWSSSRGLGRSWILRFTILVLSFE
jgi:hypothetical protein